MFNSAAVDDSIVAWSDFQAVWVAPKDGGPAELIAGGLPLPVQTIALQDGFIYWTHGQPLGSVMRAPLDGGPPQTLATQQPGLYGLRVDQTHAYWTLSQQGEIRRVPRAGGTVSVVVSGESSPTHLALDATHLYWGGINGGIRRAPLSGGAPVALYPAMWGVGGVAVHGGFVYWSEDSAFAAIRRGPVQGGAVQTIAINQDVPRRFDTDGAELYWFNGGSNFTPTPRLYSAPLDGGPPVLLLTTPRSGPVVLDRTHVYFGAQSLFRLAR